VRKREGSLFTNKSNKYIYSLMAALVVRFNCSLCKNKKIKKLNKFVCQLTVKKAQQTKQMLINGVIIRLVVNFKECRIFFFFILSHSLALSLLSIVYTQKLPTTNNSRNLISNSRLCRFRLAEQMNEIIYYDH
jgi:hypothetical protein